VPSLTRNPDPRLAPSRTRWKILALLTLISVITYVDRVNISVAARQMMPALGLTQIEIGYVFSAFVLGYALFQVPGGWLADRFGARHLITLLVLGWSLLTGAAALAGVMPAGAVYPFNFAYLVGTDTATFSSPSVTVPAGGSATVDVNIAANPGLLVNVRSA